MSKKLKIVSILALVSIIILIISAYSLWIDRDLVVSSVCPEPLRKSWSVQSVDTMKYSRDHARKRMKDDVFMDETIPQQVEAIARTGATHIAIDTPYDDEFFPMLERWVRVARINDLSVMFRGNWSGWEGWFEYPKTLSRQEHAEKTYNFILDNPKLFENDDIFSACPECENGGPGDPRHNGDVEGHRKFLIELYEKELAAFEKIGKDVAVDHFSMNGDVAELVMDPDTTKALGGVVTIDHYVKTPEQLSEDAARIAKKSGGKIFIGEFGVPLSGLHGSMSEDEQADWIRKALALLKENGYVEGVNYWVNIGGSTALWDQDRKPFLGVAHLKRYYKPRIFYGQIKNELGHALEGVRVHGQGYEAFTDENGCFAIKHADEDDLLSGDETIGMSLVGYKEETAWNSQNVKEHNIALIKNDKSLLFNLQQKINQWKSNDKMR